MHASKYYQKKICEWGTILFIRLCDWYGTI